MQQYPFSAIIGQERLKAALLACAVDPSIGGILVRGEKGTAKTTAVRALAALLPEIAVMESCPFSCDPEDADTVHLECAGRISTAAAKGETPESQVRPVRMVELPLNATEDRLAGTIHIEDTLKYGERRFEPGLMAAANRGILYIDEVNLLEDHLVDLVLDAAATGVNRIAREGFDMEHPARFLLVGTMNPEEGELRPQFLDRFALSVAVSGEYDPDVRKAIAKRRLAFERDRGAFAGYWKEEEERLRELVRSARRRLPGVKISEAAWDALVAYSALAKVQGHRSDIVMAKCAAALAALRGKNAVGPEELQEAARLALPHRIAGTIDETPETVMGKLEAILEGGAGEAAVDTAAGDMSREFSGNDAEESSGVSQWYDDSPDALEEFQVPGAAAAGSIVFDFLQKKNPQ
jgi:Mg-chelatase subunit ChlI